ncbi:uncharacterized protein LOC131301760 isoform X1 [Rhododendron vialii]|uniref:uncharacterized protein LOC131301760 isoform X1 n=1 Tax=Rhododendron vialii TaxID=182163 RepID=UPI00265FC4F5|nr:uncharacterized protein LOC131301760 isoform X1 [Rhododendron vialii]
MSCNCQSATPTIRTVTIPYSHLKDKNVDLSAKIEEGFGPNGLGILSISDVPGYSSLRQNLLRLSPRLASLPEDVKKELEDPNSRYNFGWSHGKEKLESGKPDILKGSFYANPILDRPTTDMALVQRYPSYCGSNIWPDRALPELEVAFKALGKLILDVGLMVAYHSDKYVSRGMKMHEDEGLEQILNRSRCHKGRLLYYFPSIQSIYTEDHGSMSSWCGWHTDHGSLTGLTCGMFMKDAVEIPCPDSAAGLYIKTRTDQIVKVVFGEDEIAYQIGETTEILSRGHLCATPHCVRAPKGKDVSGIDRSTFALFMQPDWDEKLNFPEVVHIHQELISAHGSLTFGEYTEKLLDKYYHFKTKAPTD